MCESMMGRASLDMLQVIKVMAVVYTKASQSFGRIKERRLQSRLSRMMFVERKLAYYAVGFLLQLIATVFVK